MKLRNTTKRKRYPPTSTMPKQTSRLYRLRSADSDPERYSLLQLKRKVEDAEEKCRKRAILERAVEEVIQLRAANGGVNKYGDIKGVIARYQSVGYDFVTRGAVCYRLSISVASDIRQNSDCHIPNNETSTSTPCEASCDERRASIPEGVVVGNESGTRSDLSSSMNQGGRRVGKTDGAKLQSSINLQNALTKASLMFAEERTNAKSKGLHVTNGCLNYIAREVENEFGLPEGSVNKKTVLSRVDRNNLTGAAPQRTSPLANVEPSIVETCIRLANMGDAMTKDQVITLVNSLIEGTKSRRELIKFKSKRKLYCNMAIVGKGWYQGFLRRNNDRIIQKQGRIQVVNVEQELTT